MRIFCFADVTFVKRVEAYEAEEWQVRILNIRLRDKKRSEFIFHKRASPISRCVFARDCLNRYKLFW